MLDHARLGWIIPPAHVDATVLAGCWSRHDGWFWPSFSSAALARK
jgi:hypothetical protein